MERTERVREVQVYSISVVSDAVTVALYVGLCRCELEDCLEAVDDIQLDRLAQEVEK